MSVSNNTALVRQSQEQSIVSREHASLDWSDLSLHPDHLADLMKSGLSATTVHKAEICTARPSDINKLAGWQLPHAVTSAMVIRYPGTDFYRLKIFPPYQDHEGHTRKYIQPKGSAPHLYIPPHSRATLYDTATPLVIVEGEKKALKASQEGLGCVVGLGGIWSFMHEGKVIAELSEIPVEGRTVEIVPDSDAATNKHIRDAVNALTKYLVSRGATVIKVELPAWGDGKVGLDDYLCANSTEHYYRLKRVRREPKPRKAASITTDGETPLSDQYNAEAFVMRHGSNVRYCYAWGQWLVWFGTRWKIDNSGEVMRRAKQTIKSLAHEIPKANDTRVAEILPHLKKSLSEKCLKSMLALAQSEPGVQVTPEQLDANPYLLNCHNCTIDLRSGEMREHRREDLITKMVKDDMDYYPLARCPNWDKALLRFMGERQELVDFLQRAAGYSLTGAVREHVLFFMYGAGQNGKSTYSETMQALMGDYFQKAPISLLMTNDRRGSESASPDVARLLGMRMVIANEIQEGHQLNESQVKDLTGGDTLAARKLYHEYFQFQPTHKVWVYGNHKPTIKGTDDGIWRRLKLIPFTVKIPDSEKIDGFRETYLLPELAGILAWAVRGAIDWYKRGLQVPDVVNMATSEYRQEMDVVQRFIDECCFVHKDAKVEPKYLYKGYKQWCDVNKEEAVSPKKFGERLESKGFGISKSNGIRYRNGLGLEQSEDKACSPF